MGPLPPGKKKVKFLVTAINYFTKWVEVKPLAVILEAKIQHFVWKNLVCQFGIPQVIISDNGRQFDNHKFRDFCKELVIRNHYSSPGHPQANGQTEVINQTLLKLIKTRLEGAKGAWPDELPRVLWAYRTMVRTPTGEMPFKMVFGTEAVVPVEVGVSSLKRERMIRYNNQRVKLKCFNPRDMVLRKVSQATKDPNEGKLGSNWEGPYKVVRYSRRGSYYLEDTNGKPLPHLWNVEHL